MNFSLALLGPPLLLCTREGSRRWEPPRSSHNPIWGTLGPRQRGGGLDRARTGGDARTWGSDEPCGALLYTLERETACRVWC